MFLEMPAESRLPTMLCEQTTIELEQKKMTG
jgi:hypothetical protein